MSRLQASTIGRAEDILHEMNTHPDFTSFTTKETCPVEPYMEGWPEEMDIEYWNGVAIRTTDVSLCLVCVVVGACTRAGRKHT